MTTTALIRKTKNGLCFDIQVNPHASRAEILGIADGVLKLKVTAPPVEGAANIAVVGLLAKALGLRKSQMTITAGTKGRKKTILVADIAQNDLEQKLALLAEA